MRAVPLLELLVACVWLAAVFFGILAAENKTLENLNPGRNQAGPSLVSGAMIRPTGRDPEGGDDGVAVNVHSKMATYSRRLQLRPPSPPRRMLGDLGSLQWPDLTPWVP
jgi:hypothetical protein